MLIGIDAHNLEGNRTGVGRYLFNLLKEWNKLANSEWPIANSKFVLFFKDEIPADLPKSNLFEFKLLKTGSTAKFTHWDLPRAAKKDKVDVLFCPGYIAPLWYKGKIALTLHDIIYEAHPEWFNWPSRADKILLKWVSKKSAKKAAIIFAPSEFSRQEIIKYYGATSAKIIVTPLAVDPSLTIDSKFMVEKQIPPTPLLQKGGEEDIKLKYGIYNNFIFFVGSIFSRRHLSEVIEAFSRLAEEENNLQLLISGADYTSGRAVSRLIGDINKKFGGNAIIHIDFLSSDELKLLYSVCYFFIWLSDYEGFGLPPLEAMRNGAPVITSDSTSLKEVAGQAALLIKNNADVDEIYQVMKRLVDNQELRAELSQKGRAQAAKFSWQICAEKTLCNLLKLS